MDSTRPYQSEAVARIVQALRENRRHILAVMPVGSGKSKVAELVARELLTTGSSVTILAFTWAGLVSLKSQLSSVANRHPNSRLEFATPAQLAAAARAEHVDISGHVVIVLDTSPANFLKEDSGVWGMLHKAAAVVGFTAVPSLDDERIFGEPVYKLSLGDAVTQGISPRIHFTSFVVPTIRKDASEAEIGVVLDTVRGRIGVEKCLFVSRYTAVVKLLFSHLSRNKPAQISLGRISAPDAKERIETARHADWIVMNASLMAGLDLPGVRHVVLLDRYGDASGLLNAVRHVLRSGEGHVWDFGDNQRAWNHIVKGERTEEMSVSGFEASGAAPGTDAFSPQKWIRPQADGAATRDLMDRDRLIHVLRGIVKSKSEDRSLAIGLFGRWGSGKSTIVNLLKKQMDDGKNIVFIEFNAWENEQVSSMPASLADAITQQIYRQRGFFGRFWLLVKHRILINDTLFNLTIGALIVLLVTMSPIQKLDDKLEFSRLATIGVKLQNLMKVILPIFLAAQVVWKSPLAQGLRGMLKHVGYAEHIGLTRRLRDDLKKLFEACRTGPVRGLANRVRKWRGTEGLSAPTYVVVIDDLDRCSRQNVWNVVEASRLVADFKDVVLLFAVDYRLLFDAVAERLHDKTTDAGERERLSREFLAKILQLSVQLPEPSTSAVARYIAEGLFHGVADAQRKDDRKGIAAPGPENTISAPPVVQAAAEEALALEEDEETLEQTDEYIVSTPVQKAIFQECAAAFDMTNPRALLRLYNSLTLIKGMHPAVGDSEGEYRRHAFHVFLTELCSAHGQSLLTLEQLLAGSAPCMETGAWKNVRAYAERHGILGGHQSALNRVAEQRARTTSLPIL